MVSSEDENNIYERPKRVKLVFSSFKLTNLSPIYTFAHRCLTKKEVIIEGLSTGKDAPLAVREGGCAGRGVFATSFIRKGQWLCEYKGLVYPCSQLEKHIKEYNTNGEGSYIVTSEHPVGEGTRLCWDATRYMHQYGRYLNHARQPNASLTPPTYVRGKWRIGFLAAADIDEGCEVVWDYGVGKEVEWGRCRMMDGVVVSGTDEAGPSRAVATEEEVRLN